eukprot:4317853-Prymnesium_polylepis.1
MGIRTKSSLRRLRKKPTVSRRWPLVSAPLSMLCESRRRRTSGHRCSRFSARAFLRVIASALHAATSERLHGRADARLRTCDSRLNRDGLPVAAAVVDTVSGADCHLGAAPDTVSTVSIGRARAALAHGLAHPPSSAYSSTSSRGPSRSCMVNGAAVDRPSACTCCCCLSSKANFCEVK